METVGSGRAGETGGSAGTVRADSAVFAYYRRLERVRGYVQKHLAEPITLSDVARVAGMERTSFSAFFHDKTGVCFRDWLAGARVERAAALLARGNLSIRRAALEAGFSSLRTCERAFTKVVRQPPRAFKRSVRPA